jgi:uncharacterized membrane protein YhaH (DUF805 family)
VLTLTASGSVSDYSDSDKSGWQEFIAIVAGVDKSLVTIRVAAASVLITATIAVPASKTADQVQTSLSSSLGTADAASTALGVTVEEEPIVEIVGSDSSSDLSVPLIVGIAVGAFVLVVLLSAGACVVVRRQQEQNRPGGVSTPDPEVGYQYQTSGNDHDVKVESV